VGSAYQARLALEATRRGTWSVAGGTLPAGLTLSTSGVLAGTPSAPGSAQVTVRFTDWIPYAVTRSLTLTVTD
jgi:hypothetical protein